MPRAFKPTITLGDHKVTFVSWSDETSQPNADGEGGNAYTSIKYKMDNEADVRSLSIFDGGLDLFCNGVAKQTGWDTNNTDTNAFLDFLMGKTVTGNYYVKKAAKPGRDGRTEYHNWGWDRSKATAPASRVVDEDDAPLPDIG